MESALLSLDICKRPIMLNVNVWGYEFIAFAVYVDDFYIFITLEVFTQFRDVYIHRACVKVIVINPNGFKCEVALKNFIGVCT